MKFLDSLLFVIFLLGAAYAVDIHIRQSSTHAFPDGSEDAPYSSLQQAIEDALDSNTYLKHPNTTFLIQDGTQLDILSPISIAASEESSLSIAYQPALDDPEHPCSALPLLNFNTTTAVLDFQPADWNSEHIPPSIQPKAKLFRLQGFRVSYPQLPDDDNNILEIHNVERVEYKHICYTGNGSSLQPDEQMVRSISSSFTHISEVVIDTVVQETLHPIQLSLEEVEVSVAVNGLSLLLSQKAPESIPDYAALKIKNADSNPLKGIATLHSISFKCRIPFSDSDVTAVISTQLLIQNLISAEVANLNLSNCSLLIEDTVIHIENVEDVHVQDLKLTNVSLSVVESDSLKTAHLLVMDGFNTARLDNFHLRNLSLHYFAAEELDIGADFMVLRTQKSNPDFFVTGFQIKECNMYSPFTLLHIDAVEPISRSYLPRFYH